MSALERASTFMHVPRVEPQKRAIRVRLKDWREVETDLDHAVLETQAARCMDCGIPYCHKGCPLGNLIPDWNDLVQRSACREAIERLHQTNNFPELTGRICPAPCEQACVLAINDAPVTIKQIEKQIIDHAFGEGWVAPAEVKTRTGKRIAVVGSGPAGLAAAQQLARVGHEVTVLERNERVGGLLRFGIPDFKLEKWVVDRRLAQLRAEGVEFRTGVNVGLDVSLAELMHAFDATILAIGALEPRRLAVPGHDLTGIHLAMDYLTEQNRALADKLRSPAIDARDRRVVILGGGDTGADCLGTAHRQRARSVHHFHYKPPPPLERTTEMPWPWWPMTLRESSSHEEGGVRDWSIVTEAFTGDASGRVTEMHCVRAGWETADDGVSTMKRIPGTEFTLSVDLVLLAIGFVGPQVDRLQAPALTIDPTGTIAVDARYRTSLPGVFACGDATRGASLVVWAIWEGRETARSIDLDLMGESSLPTFPNVHPL